MNNKLDVEKDLLKLKENKYDLTQLNLVEFETLLKYASGIIKAISIMGEAGLKSQEKVYISIDKAMDIFADQLKNPNLSDEYRDKLNDRIERRAEKASQKDTEFKKWISTSIGIVIGGAVLTLAGKNPEMRNAVLKLLNKDKTT